MTIKSLLHVNPQETALQIHLDCFNVCSFSSTPFFKNLFLLQDSINCSYYISNHLWLYNGFSLLSQWPSIYPCMLVVSLTTTGLFMETHTSVIIPGENNPSYSSYWSQIFWLTSRIQFAGSTLSYLHYNKDCFRQIWEYLKF